MVDMTIAFPSNWNQHKKTQFAILGGGVGISGLVR